MKSAISVLVSLLILAAPAFAQSVATLKRDLRKREVAAKKEKTAEALCGVATWASEKGLAADARRLFTAAIKIDPTHEAANLGLGNALFEGKWMPKKKADDLRKKAMAAAFKAKGWVEVDDIWVEKAHVKDAKNGIFYHEGQRITRDEKEALLADMVYHPSTGLLINKADLEKAEQGQYPIGREGRWAGEAEADTWHSDRSHPWVVRSAHGTVVTTLPMARILELKTSVDRACERIGPLFGSTPPPPTHRPTVLVAATLDEYREVGNEYGDETSAASAFLMDKESSMKLPFQGDVRTGICTGHQAAMAPYYTRHAAAMAYLQGKCVEAEVEVPDWFLHGVGALAGFFENDRVGAHFCRTMVVVKGGVNNLRTFFNDFAINGDMDPNDISFNWTVSGLMIHFAMQGGDADSTDALVKVTKAFEKGKGIEKAIKGLQSALVDAEEKVAAHMQKMMDANR